MRILLVHNYYQQRGGEDVVVEQEMDLLLDKGHEAELFSVHNNSIQSWRQKATTAAFVPYNPWAKTAFAKKLAEFRPDVVHVHNFFPQLSPSIFDACRAAGIPCVMTLHNFRILCPTSILFHDGRVCEKSLGGSALWAVPQRVYRSSLAATLPMAVMVDLHKAIGTWRRKVDLFIALTDFAKTKFIEGGLRAERIVVKGNALRDPCGGAVASAHRHGALFVGRLSPEKGIATLLSSWADIDYPLRIAGDGPLQAMCKAAQSKTITYLGRLSRERIYAEMRMAAFLVLPSICYEMFPMTLVEAYANGLPVLASDLGGFKGLVQDKITGFTFEPGEPADLQAKIRYAIEHPEVMVALGQNARAVYEASYTAERNYAALVDIYGHALADSGKFARS